MSTHHWHSDDGQSTHSHQFKDERVSSEAFADLLDGHFAYDVETTQKSMQKAIMEIGKYVQM